MQIENQTCAYLLVLLRCALTGAPAPAAPEGLDFDAFFDLARRQQVYNIVFPLLAALPGVPEGEKKRWENYTYTELTRTITMDHERGQLFARLDEAGIDYMPLKGLLLREYYPKTSMRQMTDNDILYDPVGREQLLRIMRKAGYKMTACGENSDDFHKPPYATFEFHRTLFFDEKDFCPRFDGLWQRATRDPDHPHAFVMDVSDNYLYTVAHMYKHYSTNGCGVRFLADVYLLYTKESARLDRPYIEAEFRKMDILFFLRNFTNNSLFGKCLLIYFGFNRPFRTKQENLFYIIFADLLYTGMNNIYNSGFCFRNFFINLRQEKMRCIASKNDPC